MQDIHTHLYWKSYDIDRDLVVSRARAAKVEEMLVVGCTVEESKQAIVIAEQYPRMYAAVGIHPHEFTMVEQITNTQSQIPNQIDELRGLAKNKKVVAIGECGLDYYAHDKTKVINEEQKQSQKGGFLAQIALSQELGLPMILHCRPSIGAKDAYEDMFQILQNSKIITQISSLVLHCYMGDTEVTKKFLSIPNTYFSFTGNITYPVKKAFVGTKDDLGETVKIIPLDRLFTETDCPFLAPQSKRGERNEPRHVCEVVEKVALLQGVTVAEIAKATTKNFQKVFTIHP